MSKLMRLWLFLAITGIMSACGDSPTNLADECDGDPSPNSYCEEPGG